jgi:hypothetical protein
VFQDVPRLALAVHLNSKQFSLLCCVKDGMFSDRMSTDTWIVHNYMYMYNYVNSGLNVCI